MNTKQSNKTLYFKLYIRMYIESIYATKFNNLNSANIFISTWS